MSSVAFSDNPSAWILSLKLSKPPTGGFGSVLEGVLGFEGSSKGPIGVGLE